MKIIDSTGTSVNKSGITDTQGQYSYSWKADPSMSNGDYKVITSVSRPGYEQSSQTSSFQKIGQLLVKAALGKGLITSADPQTINVKVTDVSTLRQIPGATVNMKIIDSTGTSVNKSGITDTQGQYSYSWKADPSMSNGDYKVITSVSRPGYEQSSQTSSFQKIGQLLVKAALGKGLITSADPQTINVKVTDVSTLRQIPGATVNMKIIDSTGTSVNKSGITDTQGQYSYSWKADPSMSNGDYKVITSVSRPGYEQSSQTSSFQKIGQLLVKAALGKGLITSADPQTINVKVTDVSTLRQIPGATVNMKIIDSTGTSVNKSGITDTQGQYSYSWKADPSMSNGDYKVITSVSRPGYEQSSQTSSFQKIGQLLVKAALGKDHVNPGESQTINVEVTDFNTLKRIPGASISGTINNEKFSTITDNNGITSYSWSTSPTGGGNINNIILAVSSKGYNPVTKSLTYSMGEPLYLLGSKPQQHLISDNTAHSADSNDGNSNKKPQTTQLNSPTLPEHPCDVLNGRSNFDRCRAALETATQTSGNLKVSDSSKHDFLGSLTNLVTG